MENYCDFEEVTPTAINKSVSKIVVQERDVKQARYAVQRMEVYFNYIDRLRKYDRACAHTLALEQGRTYIPHEFGIVRACCGRFVPTGTNID